MHMDLDWGFQVLDGIFMKYIFIWIQTHVHIYSDADAHNHHFTTERFFAQGITSPYFGPMGRVSS
jgi:hypothetical protein